MYTNRGGGNRRRIYWNQTHVYHQYTEISLYAIYMYTFYARGAYRRMQMTFICVQYTCTVIHACCSMHHRTISLRMQESYAYFTLTLYNCTYIFVCNVNNNTYAGYLEWHTYVFVCNVHTIFIRMQVTYSDIRMLSYAMCIPYSYVCKLHTVA